jgi:hypothetical protein
MPTIHYCVAQYSNTPDQCLGFSRMGYINHWTFYDEDSDDRVHDRCRVPLKNGNKYRVNLNTLMKRIKYADQCPDMMMEVELASRSGYPYHDPYTRHAEEAFKHLGKLRQWVSTTTDTPVAAEYTNAFPFKASWLWDRDEVYRQDHVAWVAAGRPGHLTASLYGRPSVVWNAKTYTILDRMKRLSLERPGLGLPVNVVISHINSGGAHLTPAQLAQQIRVLWPKLTEQDRIIYWAAGERGRSFNDAVLPGLQAIKEAIQ